MMNEHRRNFKEILARHRGALVVAALACFAAPAHAITIDSATVTPSTLDTQGQPVLPYVASYGLSTNALVTLTVQNASNVIVRHLVTNQLQSGEAITTLHTINWDGLNDAGQPVALGLYTFVFDATDAQTSATAVEQKFPIPVVSQAAASAPNAQKIFEANAYVFPNPVRNGAANFNFIVARNQATVTLRIYTISGDLVLDQTLAAGAPAGGSMIWPASGTWDVTNAGGKKLGRGLYFCVFREEDPQGTLQVTKKMAVIK